MTGRDASSGGSVGVGFFGICTPNAPIHRIGDSDLHLLTSTLSVIQSFPNLACSHIPLPSFRLRSYTTYTAVLVAAHSLVAHLDLQVLYCLYLLHSLVAHLDLQSPLIFECL